MQADPPSSLTPRRFWRASVLPRIPRALLSWNGLLGALFYYAALAEGLVGGISPSATTLAGLYLLPPALYLPLLLARAFAGLRARLGARAERLGGHAARRLPVVRQSRANAAM